MHFKHFLVLLVVVGLAAGAVGQNITFFGTEKLKQPLGAWLSNEYTTQPISMKDALYPKLRCPVPKLPVVELTIATLMSVFKDKNSKIMCSDVVAAYIDRIKAFDKVSGMNAIQRLLPDVMSIAKAKDKTLMDFKSGKASTLPPLFCVPMLPKDNYDTVGVPTTNGAQALLDSLPIQDATMVKLLKDAGAIMVAKTNLAEWAFSGQKSIGSAFGTCRNPYDLNRVTAGSSGGTGAGVSANLGLIGLGTQTGNSITGPSSANSLVGIRPSIGATSRAGIAPLILNRDLGGPMGHTVADVAAVLSAMAYFRDPRDPVTALIPEEYKFGTDFTKNLDANFLAGKRIGWLTGNTKRPDADPKYVNPETGLFGKALKIITDLTGNPVVPVDALYLPVSNVTGAPEEAVWKATFDTGDLVRRFPNPTNTTSGGNIQPAANGTNNNMILITSERVLKNGTKETFTAYEQGACTPFKFDLKSYLAGTKSRFKDMESVYQSGLFHPVANASLYNSIYGSPSSAPGLPDTFITYTKETYADDPRYAGATCSGCAEWNEDPCRLKLRAAFEYTMKKYNLTALVFPQWSNFPRMVGDEVSPHTDNTGNISPFAGVPHIVQPMGYGNGTNSRTQFNADTLLPGGLAWITYPWREDILIGAAYAFEQAAKTVPAYAYAKRVPPPAFPECTGSTYLPSANINSS